MPEQVASAPAAPVAESKRKAVHFDFLDGLRACAALFVLVHHCVIHVPLGAPIPGTRWFAHIFAHGHYAVDLFIVLSGFCLTLPVLRAEMRLRDGVVDFIKRRAWRILPPYYAALGVSLLLILLLIGEKTGTHWDSALPVTGKALTYHLLLIHDAFKDTFSKINHVFWSISVEWRIYFLFPVFVLIWRRFGVVAMLGAALGLSFALVRALRRTSLLSEMCGISPQYVFLFALGMAAAGVAYSSEKRLATWRGHFKAPIVVIASVALFAGLIMAARLKNQPAPVYLQDYCVGLVCAAALISIAGHPSGALHRAFSWRPLVAVGAFAYSIYLMHAPLIEVIWRYVLAPLPLSQTAQVLLLWAVGPPVIVALCYPFFLLAERPFLRRRKPHLPTAVPVAQTS